MSPIISRSFYSNNGIAFKKEYLRPKFLPALLNGTQTINNTSTTWTVPALIGTVKVEVWGGGIASGCDGPCWPSVYGAYGSVTFDVVPGEVFRIDRFCREGWNMGGSPGGVKAQFGGAALAFGPDAGITLTQSTLWIIAGGGGGNAGSDNNSSRQGGHAGWTAGQAGTASGSNGQGGTQSAGGAAGAMGWDPNDIAAQPGTALLGGQGYYQPSNRGGTSTVDGGVGGSGWFGGGGGGKSSNQTGAGGGGSSRMQVPAGRNPTNTVTQDGTTSLYTGAAKIVITY